jgi:hypothetical protein
MHRGKVGSRGTSVVYIVMGLIGIYTHICDVSGGMVEGMARGVRQNMGYIYMFGDICGASAVVCVSWCMLWSHGVGQAMSELVGIEPNPGPRTQRCAICNRWVGDEHWGAHIYECAVDRKSVVGVVVGPGLQQEQHEVNTDAHTHTLTIPTHMPNYYSPKFNVDSNSSVDKKDREEDAMGGKEERSKGSAVVIKLEERDDEEEKEYNEGLRMRLKRQKEKIQLLQELSEGNLQIHNLSLSQPLPPASQAAPSHPTTPQTHAHSHVHNQISVAPAGSDMFGNNGTQIYNNNNNVHNDMSPQTAMGGDRGRSLLITTKGGKKNCC